MDDATPTPRARRKRTSTFGTVTCLDSKRWRARYVDKAGNRHGKTFDTKADAKAWLAARQTDIARGDRTDPRRGRLTFAEWADRWTEARAHREPKTLEGEEAILRLHVIPFFGRYQVTDIEHDLVQRFVSTQIRAGEAASTIRKRYRVVYGVLRQAVKGKAVPENVAVGVDLPTSRRDEKVFLTAAQVEALAEAISAPRRDPETYYPEHALRVRWAAYTGMRAGEIAGLRAGNVDLLRRTVRVCETTVVANRVVHERRPTKTKQERVIRIPRFLAEQLAEHLGARAGDRDALVFGSERHNSWYRVHYVPAVVQAGLDPTPRFHDLRHTCVALLVAQGAPILAISRQLGHSTIQVTMDLYGHIFPSMLDDLSDGLDAARTAALAEPIRPAEVRRIG
jgi:integrase